METTATRPSRTTSVLDESGRRLYVGTGCVNQREGSRPLCTCNTCGSEVVWVKSARTGRHYLANVYSGVTTRYYIAARLHDCQPILDRNQADRDHLMEQELQVARLVVGALRAAAGHDSEPLTSVSMPAGFSFWGTTGGWNL